MCVADPGPRQLAREKYKFFLVFLCRKLKESNFRERPQKFLYCRLLSRPNLVAGLSILLPTPVATLP